MERTIQYCSAGIQAMNRHLGYDDTIDLTCDQLMDIEEESGVTVDVDDVQERADLLKEITARRSRDSQLRMGLDDGPSNQVTEMDSSVADDSGDACRPEGGGEQLPTTVWQQIDIDDIFGAKFYYTIDVSPCECV